MTSPGKLIVISGPSGVGKSTVCARLLELPQFERVLTCTTRSPRADEKDGQHYEFLTRSDFDAGLRNGRFLEHAVVHGELYGTPRDRVEDAVRRGKYVLLNIDVKGAAQLRERMIDMATIFLVPPDEATLEKRLGERGTESPAQVASRMETARRELAEKDRYDHIVVNRTLDETVRKILELIG